MSVLQWGKRYSKQRLDCACEKQAKKKPPEAHRRFIWNDNRGRNVLLEGCLGGFGVGGRILHDAFGYGFDGYCKELSLEVITSDTRCPQRMGVSAGYGEGKESGTSGISAHLYLLTAVELASFAPNDTESSTAWSKFETLVTAQLFLRQH